jgi:hypothetical protein
MKIPDTTVTESFDLGFRKTLIKREPYVVQTSPTSHFVGKYLFYEPVC